MVGRRGLYRFRFRSGAFNDAADNTLGGQTTKAVKSENVTCDLTLRAQPEIRFVCVIRYDQLTVFTLKIPSVVSPAAGKFSAKFQRRAEDTD